MPRLFLIVRKDLDKQRRDARKLRLEGEALAGTPPPEQLLPIPSKSGSRASAPDPIGTELATHRTDLADTWLASFVLEELARIGKKITVMLEKTNAPGVA